MANLKTNFSISAFVNPDTSQVQKTLNRQNFTVRTNLEINTERVQNAINRMIQQPQIAGFDKINTKIREGLTVVRDFGNGTRQTYTNATRYVETFKNAIGDVYERITTLTHGGQVLNSSLKQIQNGVTEINTDTRQFSETLNGLNTTVTQVTKTTTDTAGNTRQVVETTREWTDATGRLNTEITTTNELGQQLAPTTRTVSDNIRQTGEAAQQTANQVNGLGRSFSNAVATLTRYYLASLPIRAVQTIISETVETLRDFDSALIEFRKVSDLAGESLTQYVAKLTEMGEITGSTMEAMVEASTEFRKSGFSDEDSATLASIAEMYRNVADEEISAAESASFIISQMKAFNIEAEDAMRIIDAVNDVSNHFAVSSADLATNIGKVSAALAVNGVKYEEVLGMMTAITEITRNASTASRGLNMISSRLVQVLDDSSSTGKKLTKIYEDLGIALKDDEGQMRSTYDILKDLAGKWNDLSTDQQKYIALTSAGARQTQNFVALMQNFDTAIEATAMAYGSAGSAARENEKVMDSISKKVEILRSEFQQLVLGKGGLQEFAKNILDIGIALLKFANSDVGHVVNTIAILLASIALLNTVMNLITSEAIPRLITSMVVLASRITASSITSNTAALSLMGLSEAEAIASAATMTLGEAFEALTVAMLTNPAVLIIAALTAAVGGLIILTKKLNAELDESTKRLEEYSQSYKNAKNDVENLEKSLADIQEQLKKLDNKKINITNPSQLAQLEKETAELKEQERTVERKLALAKQELEIARQQAETEAKKNLNSKTASQFERSYGSSGQIRVTAQEELDLAIKKHKELTEALEKLREEQEAYANSGENNAKKVEKYKNKIADLEEQLTEADARGVEMANTLQQDADALTTADESTQQLKSSVEASIDAWQEATGYQEDAKEQIQETNEELEEEEEEIDELSKELESLIQSLGITETEFKGLQKAFSGNEEALLSYLRNLAEVKQKLGDTSTVIDNLQDALSTASDALEEYNQNGYLTIDTFQSLMGISAQYLVELVNENGQLEINQTTLGNLVEQLKVAKIEELAHAAAMEIAALANKEADSTAQAASVSVSYAGASFAEAGKKAANAAEGVALFNAELSKATGGALGDYTGSERIIIEKYRKLAKEIGNLTVNTTKAGNAAKKAGKDAKGAADDVNKALEETKKKYETVIKWIEKQYDNEIDKIKKAKDEAVKAEEAKIKAKEKEKDAALDAIEAEIKALEREKKVLKEQKEVLDARKQALKDEEDEIVKGIEKRIKALEKERDALIKPVEERIKVLEKERDTILDSTQKEIDALTELKEERTAYWDEQINALKEANKELKDNLELQQKLDALEKAKNTKVKIYKEGQGFVYDVDQNAVQKAQKELDEYLSQKAYEDELERLENLKKAEIDSYEERLNELKKYKDNTKKLYDEQINDLKEYKDKTKENFDEQIDALKEYKETVQEEYEEQIEIINQDIEALEKHMDELDKHKDALEEHKDSVEENFEKEIAELEAHKNAVEEAYEAEIQTWENYKQEFEKMVNAYEEEQNRLLFEQLTGIKSENSNWMTRLDNLAEFVNEYNKLQKELDTGNTDVRSNASFSSGSAPSTGATSISSNTQASKSSSGLYTVPIGVKTTSSNQYQNAPSYVRAAIASNRHAGGIGSIANDEIALVGDSPNQELVIGSKMNGSLMSLSKGSGVVNAQSSRTLAGMLNQMGKYSTSGFGSGSGTLNNNYGDSLVINGVTIQGSNIHDPQTFVNSLLNLKAEALQRAYRKR